MQRQREGEHPKNIARTSRNTELMQPFDTTDTFRATLRGRGNAVGDHVVHRHSHREQRGKRRCLKDSNESRGSRNRSAGKEQGLEKALGKGPA